MGSFWYSKWSIGISLFTVNSFIVILRVALGVTVFTVTSFIVVLQVVPRCHSLRFELINRGDASGLRVRWDVLQLDRRNVHSSH